MDVTTQGSAKTALYEKLRDGAPNEQSAAFFDLMAVTSGPMLDWMIRRGFKLDQIDMMFVMARACAAHLDEVAFNIKHQQMPNELVEATFGAALKSIRKGVQRGVGVVTIKPDK